MSADLSRWPQADAILDEALARPPAERAACVARAAGNDAELRAALEAVIAESMSHDGFLEPGGATAGELGASLAAAEDDVPRLAAGSRVEHYEVGALIGRGGMGEVYRAVDTRLHRDVALKVLPDRFARDADRRARFRREARVLATLSDPGIAAIHGVAESVGVEALVLELVEGPTLAERLTAGPLPLHEVFAVARALVDAVDAAHARGILHRDLKPANVKLLSGGGVKVLDFGLAKALSGDAAPAAVGPTDLTGVGSARLMGTVAYMSPEQLRGEALDARSDIWSFGCVLFEMLTGTRAFAGDAPAEVMARVLEREPAFGLLPPGTPAALRR
ncbi:MAG TPA: serine/threonine-protein kinase, partial [Vicinamibacterales bacterium]|nr:serine/threonine-protein kinase [Vicinamibacterales bacterium]